MTAAGGGSSRGSVAGCGGLWRVGSAVGGRCQTEAVRRYTFGAELWAYGGEASWVFVTVPADVSADIRALPRPPRPGFGSLKVAVRLGGTSWSTSIFPDAKSGCYVLPVKKAVRTAERVDDGDTVTVELTLRE